MSIYEEIYKFCNNLTEMGYVTDRLEMTLDEPIFMDLLADAGLYQRQGDLFAGYAKLPDHVLVGHLNGHIKVKKAEK